MAKLAGVPRNVVKRAREILTELERSREPGKTASSGRELGQPALPGLLGGLAAPAETAPPHAESLLLDELSRLELDRMTPLEALTKLCDWKNRFGGPASQGD